MFAYVKLVALIKQKYPQAKVVMIIGDKIHEGTRQAILKIANYYGAKYGYKCVDFLAPYNGATISIGKLPSDGTHPDESGFETMAEHIYRMVGDYIE